VTETWSLFDRLADQYDEALPFFATFGAMLMDRLDPAPGSRLLDIGSGRGALVAPALARGCVVTATEPSPRMVDRLRVSYPGVDVRCLDACALDLPDASFDLATGGFVIHIVADTAKALSELHRVVRPGGTVAFTEPGEATDDGRWDDFSALVQRYRQRAVRPGRPGRDDVDIAELLPVAGFTDLHEENIEIHLPVPDPETCWRFHMSHGFAGFLESLTPEDAAEFRTLAMAEFGRMHDAGGIILDRGAWVTTATVA